MFHCSPKDQCLFRASAHCSCFSPKISSRVQTALKAAHTLDSRRSQLLLLRCLAHASPQEGAYAEGKSAPGCCSIPATKPIMRARAPLNGWYCNCRHGSCGHRRPTCSSDQDYSLRSSELGIGWVGGWGGEGFSSACRFPGGRRALLARARAPSRAGHCTPLRAHARGPGPPAPRGVSARL